MTTLGRNLAFPHLQVIPNNQDHLEVLEYFRKGLDRQWRGDILLSVLFGFIRFLIASIGLEK